jgi:death-on-curing protein
MRYLSTDEVMELHQLLAAQSGGSQGVRDRNGLESAIAQPSMTFDGQELYSTIAEKAVALGFTLIKNHPFVDGNKRIGHAAMETFLILNGFEIDALPDKQEQIILGVASGRIGRGAFVDWIRAHLITHRTGQ